MTRLTDEEVKAIKAEIHKMLPLQLRLEIAKARGCTWDEQSIYLEPPYRSCYARYKQSPSGMKADLLLDVLPDYINDLVACLPLIEEAGIVLIPIKLYSQYRNERIDERDLIGTRWKAWAKNYKEVEEESAVFVEDEYAVPPYYEKPGEAICRAYLEFIRGVAEW